LITLIISGLTLVFCLYYGYLVLYLRKGWKLIEPHRIDNAISVKTHVSVVIAARNEEQHIAEVIEAILKQDYPASLFELIVVDDHSTDRTGDIVSSYTDYGVKLIRLNMQEPLNSYKKKAISEAIAQANGELIVATDADCLMGINWLKCIVSLYEQSGYKLISSPVVYHKEGNFFERLQTLEFLYLIGLGAATIGLKRPSTCNGANLAYRRDVFYELDGFKGIDDLASGDDELFLHKVAQRYPTAVGFCKAQDAIVYTTAKRNLGDFITQRRRWASKSTKYKDGKVVAMGVSIWLFNVLILLSGMLSPLFQMCGYVLVGVLCIKILVEWLFLLPLTQFAHKRTLLGLLPLLSVLHVFYIIYIGVAGNTGKYHWKGRFVR